jgi:citrate synthase
MDHLDRMLTTEEAARRLGVKVPTLYAYVSRGRLESHPDPSGRGSLFDMSEVETLAARSRESRTTTRLATVTTAVTRLHQDRGPFYRGRAATELAASSPFEDVAEWLWQSPARGDWSAPPLGTCPLTSTMDRMRWALVMCGAADPLRSDRRPEAVARAARRTTAALVDVVGPSAPARLAVAVRASEPDGSHERVDGDGLSLASRLATRLADGADRPIPTAAVNAALVLMADHELAASTLAVRVAASVRADPYDAFSAGLATLAGPYHGGASQQVFELLAMAERDGASRALDNVLREHGSVPGFGHTVYTGGDPRYGALMELAEPLLDEGRRALVFEMVALAAAHEVPPPNCDLALAALSWGTGMPPDTGRTLFTVARVAGWTAHYLEELVERPLRFRARAVYASA